MPSFRSDLRSWEWADTPNDGDAGPVRTIGRFLADSPPRQEASRHSLNADLPAQDISPDTDLPAENIPPHADLPAQDTPPDTDLPAQDISPDTDLPAQDISPDTGLPAENIPPHADLPAQNTPPDTDLPAENIPPDTGLPAQNIPPHADLPAQEIRTLQRRRVRDRVIDDPDPIDLGATVTHRRPIKHHAAPGSPGTMVQDRPRQSGFVMVLAVVAASVLISVGLVWAVNLHHSPSSVGVTPIDTTHSAPRFDDLGGASTGRSASTKYRDSLRDLNERGLDDADDPAQDDLSTDPDLGADPGSARLSDPGDLSGASGYPSDPTSLPGTRSGGLDDGTSGLDLPDRSAPTTGPRTRQQPRSRHYRDDSRYPDYPRDSGRSRPALPSLGGL